MSALYRNCQQIVSLRRFYAQSLQHFKFVSVVGYPISSRDVTIPLILCEPLGAEVYMGRRVFNRSNTQALAAFSLR